jgi:ubiquitin-protein ligase E3 C
LGASASRKCAEENKASRKKLLEQQQKKAAAQKRAAAAAACTAAPKVVSTASSAPGLGPSPVAPSAAPPPATKAAPVVTAAAAASTATRPHQNNVLTAVERAQQQRQMRAKSAQLQKSAIQLQAWLRGRLTQKRVRDQETVALQQKLSDLTTVVAMLREKGQSFVPPVSTTTALVRTLLFITRFKVGQDHVQMLGQVLEGAVLPALRQDESKKPSLAVVWMREECFVSDKKITTGQYRLKRLIHCVLLTAFEQPQIMEDVLSPLLRLLRTILVDSGTVASPSVLSLEQYCRQLMLFPYQEAVADKEFDLMTWLRHYLLFVQSSKPIPDEAEAKRENCFAASEKNRAGALFQLLTDVSGVGRQQRQLQARIVRDILTVPLLSWRLSSSTLSFLVSSSSSSSDQPLLLVLLRSFMDEHGPDLTAGNIEAFLSSDDLPMTKCPASGAQRLLANLLQIGRLCPCINANAVNTRQDFETVTTFFELISVLVDAVPLETFLTSRESSVQWISDGKGHLQPIVLSPVVLDQCKALLVDSYVTRLFYCAIDTDILQTEKTLSTKTDKDLKHEKDLAQEGTSSATVMAAKEARIDRNKSLWNSSKWARKLTKGVANMFDTGKKPSSNEKKSVGKSKEGELMNTSAVSRQLAEGMKPSSNASASTALKSSRRDVFSTEFLFVLVRTYSIILARWGGSGGKDEISSISSKQEGKGDAGGASERATSRPDPCTMSLLNVLCFSTSFVRASWAIIQSDEAIISDIYTIIDAEKGKQSVRTVNIRPDVSSWQHRRKTSNSDGASLLFFFLCTLSHVLIVTDDVEIHDMDRPLPIHQIRRCIQVMKKLLYRAACVDDVSGEANYFGLALISASARTMRDLYDRSSRRPLCVPTMWIVSGLLEKEMGRCRSCNDYTSLLSSSPVLRLCPFLVSFKRRLRLFERIVTTSRIEVQGETSANPFHNNPLKPGIPVRITRGRILEDGLATMNTLGKNMRQRISVQYYNEAGTRETGVDAGGLFKDFWTDLCAIAFDPNYALFRVTEGDAGNCLYPNPSSAAAHGAAEHLVLFEFLGRILGKAMYEGITIHPLFAHFFLSFLRGDYNYLHMLPDLSTVDPQLYQNLMFLKTYDGDTADLCLSFTVTTDDFGCTQEIPLIPNGNNVEVTNQNKHRYIGLVAKYYVVDRVKEQSEAFTRGLWEVVDRSWLRIFNEPELQVLISGASDGKIDVEDWKGHSRYVGGYTSIDRNVHRFWNVVASMDGKQQAALLRFVTSCERPPPLGFASMNPPFTIQRVGILRDGDRLPTASTCFNTLKLPTYSSEKVLRQRLLYAIESGAGFELT